MTRKDYILIADVLHNIKTRAGFSTPANETIDATMISMADALYADNPRFDREHFLQVVRGEKDLNSRPPRKSAPIPMRPAGFEKGKVY